VLLTSNWRSSASSSLRLGGTSTAPAGASAVPAGTSTDDPAAGGSVPALGVNPTATPLLTVYIRIKLHVDLQADKSPVVVKGPFFP
jgi:hypothetical protein